jgi:hypothetical protein
MYHVGASIVEDEDRRVLLSINLHYTHGSNATIKFRWPDHSWSTHPSTNPPGPMASLNIISSPRLALVQRYFLAHEPCAQECGYPLDELDELDKGSHMRHCPLRDSQPVVAVA